MMVAVAVKTIETAFLAPPRIPTLTVWEQHWKASTVCGLRKISYHEQDILSVFLIA